MNTDRQSLLVVISLLLNLEGMTPYGVESRARAIRDFLQRRYPEYFEAYSEMEPK